MGCGDGWESDGSRSWARTTIHAFKGRCPTIRRSGKIRTSKRATLGLIPFREVPAAHRRPDKENTSRFNGFVYNLLMTSNCTGPGCWCRQHSQLQAQALDLRQATARDFDVSRAAQIIYEEGGGTCWGLEDEITRLYYLRLAAQNAETKSPAL